MVAVRDVKRPPATHDPLIAVIKILQAVQIVQIPGDRGLLAVDLERIERFVAAGVACGLEAPEGTVSEAGEEEACVVDPDRFDFARQVVHPLLDERVGHRHR